MYFALFSWNWPEIAVALTTRTPSASHGELHNLKDAFFAMPSPPIVVLFCGPVLGSGCFLGNQLLQLFYHLLMNGRSSFSFFSPVPLSSSGSEHHSGYWIFSFVLLSFFMPGFLDFPPRLKPFLYRSSIPPGSSNAAHCGHLDNVLRVPSFINKLCGFCFDVSPADCSRPERPSFTRRPSECGFCCRPAPCGVKGPSFTNKPSDFCFSIGGTACQEILRFRTLFRLPVSGTKRPSFTNTLFRSCSGIGRAVCPALRGAKRHIFTNTLCEFCPDVGCAT